MQIFSFIGYTLPELFRKPDKVEVFYNKFKYVLKYFAIFTGKYLPWSLFLIQNIEKFLRTPILKNISKTLLLFVSPPYTTTNSGGEFELDETSTGCKVYF